LVRFIWHGPGWVDVDGYSHRARTVTEQLVVSIPTAADLYTRTTPAANGSAVRK